jgi:hypothetical protein
VKDIRVEIHSLGRDCRVTVDGEDLFVRRCVIRADVNEITRIELEAFKRDGEPITFKGRLLEDEDAPPPSPLMRRFCDGPY